MPRAPLAEPRPPQWPTVSVVMPYYRNERTLPAVLTALAAQSTLPQEVVVVDDGAEPTAQAIGLTLDLAGMGFLVRWLKTQRGGQSAATNRGIAAAGGDVVVLLCADIIADADLVTVHRQAHQEAADEVAVVGSIPYAETVPMTPFMRYLAETRVQFGFDAIDDPEDVSPLYCYAPNFSARLGTLRRLGGFDERFVYGYQDTDLGRRLAQMGVRFVYRAGAVGAHDHPTCLDDFVRRQYAIGDATLTWLEKWRNADETEKVRQVVATYLPYVDKIDRAMADIATLESRLPGQRWLPAPLRERLFNLYTLVTNTAILSGMLRQRSRLERAVGQAVDAGAGP